MEDRDAQEFANVLTGYFRLLAGKLKMSTEKIYKHNTSNAL